MPAIDKEALYATPRSVASIDDCYFYHTMDIPGHGTVEGEWDLRPGIDAYLGNIEIRGKRVLEIGTASGFLCFHMEKQGAEVVAFDLSSEQEWDIVPYYGWREQEARTEFRQHINRLNNSYWFAHRANQSRAKVVYGTVYEVPPEIGPVDVTTFCSVLLHVRDPFLALQAGLRQTREAVVITEVLHSRKMEWLESLIGPFAQFLPDHRAHAPWNGWWNLYPQLLIRMVSVLGFTDVTVTRHSQSFMGRRPRLFTIVARRPRGGNAAQRTSS